MPYIHPDDNNLKNLHKAMEYDADGKPVLRTKTNIDGDITITGDVTIPGTVTVSSTPQDPVHTHITEVGTSGILAVPYLPIGGTVDANVTFPSIYKISKDTNANSDSNRIFVNASGTVELGTTTLSALENITVSGSVSVSNFPATQAVTGTFWQATQPVSIATMPTTPVTGTFWQATQPVSIASLPEIEIKNDTGNPIPVTATITDVITVVVNEDAGDKYSFNNHAANATRGWTMDNTMRPVVSFQNGSANAADIIKILEYEIGNNNANQSTIVYEWYEGPLTIAGAAIPSWTTFGQHSQYRVYQDQYSSNQGNTFTVPAGTYMRHSGIIIGKNTSGDEGPASLYGGSNRNMLTLCMRRVDNATKLDVWFAFTVRELA
jgi:hypothetical protein